jgi:undecaprenyl-diphosphatase
MRTLALAFTATLVAALAVTLAVALTDTPMPSEERILHEVQGWSFPGQTLSAIVRALTTTWLVIVLGCTLAAGLAVRGDRRDALVLLAILFVLVWLQPTLKNIVDRPRPDPGEFDVRSTVTSESYPSGHVMSPTVLYGYVIALCATMPWPRTLRYAGIAVSSAILVLTGIVSLWLGVHWPADIVGGYLWGAAIVLGAIWAAREVDHVLLARRT